MSSILQFTEQNFVSLCNELAHKETALASIIEQYGYPPLWKRDPGFETLVHIILEQQVSLASAKAAFDKLKNKLGRVTPENIILLTNEELRACYLSRQKTMYVQHLATAIVSKKINLNKLTYESDDKVREALVSLKGIGNWTADVYLMMALQRTDLFPIGDIALINSIKTEMQLPTATTKDAIVALANNWQPYRSIATYLFWHAYLCKRKRTM